MHYRQSNFMILSDMKRTLVLFLVLIFFASCGKKKMLSDRFFVLPLYESLHRPAFGNIPENRVKECRVIPLETSDSVLLRRCDIQEVTDDYIIISDHGTVYFFDRAGNLSHKFNRRGNGPGEYVSINEIVLDETRKTVYVHDYSRRIINRYTYEGKLLDHFKNDSIASMGITEDGEFVASFSPSEKWTHLVGVYDSNWNPVNSFIENDFQNEKTNLFIINTVNSFNGRPCIYTNDTLFRITATGTEAELVIDKGPLRLPEEIASDVRRKRERDRYIWGDYGFLTGNYYFLYFNYDGKGYYDLWDLSSATLIGRNVLESFGEKPGLPFRIDGKTVYAWPLFADGDKIYCALAYEDAVVLHPLYKDNDNPVILEITFDSAS